MNVYVIQDCSTYLGNIRYPEYREPYVTRSTGPYTARKYKTLWGAQNGVLKIMHHCRNWRALQIKEIQI